MSKRLGCLAVFFGGVALYGAWVSQPPSRHETDVKAMLGRIGEREAKEEALAKTSKENGYLNQEFLPFWGRKGLESAENSPIRSQVGKLVAWSDLSEGKDLGLEKAKQVAEFEQLEQLYENFHKVASSPEFLVPREGRMDAGTLYPNLLAFRNLAYSMSAYSEYLCLHQKPAQALQVALDITRFGRQIDRQVFGLITAMISIAIESLGMETTSMVLSGHLAEIPTSELEAFRDALVPLVRPREDIVTALEVEFYGGLNTLEQLSKNGRKSGSSHEWLVVNVPGLRAREIRLFKNDFSQAVTDFRGNRDYESTWTDQSLMKDWFLGRHGIFSAILIPNFKRAGINFMTCQAKLGFLHLYLDLVIQARKTGTWPADLKKYSTSLLGGLSLDQVSYQVKGKEMRLESTRPESLPGSVQPGMQKWSHLSGPKWSLDARI
jgi:hypothetical protein